MLLTLFGFSAKFIRMSPDQNKESEVKIFGSVYKPLYDKLAINLYNSISLDSALDKKQAILNVFSRFCSNSFSKFDCSCKNNTGFCNRPATYKEDQSVRSWHKEELEITPYLIV